MNGPRSNSLLHELPHMAVTKVFINLSFSKYLIATLCGVVRGVVNYSADRSFGVCFCRQYCGGISDPVLR